MNFVVLTLNFISLFFLIPFAGDSLSDLKQSFITPRDFFSPAINGKKLEFYVQVYSLSTLVLPGPERAMRGLNTVVNIALEVPL